MPPNAIVFNPFLFEVQQDPYTHYARLRDLSPVCFIESLDAWGVFRYDDVVYTLKHPELFSARNFIANAFDEFDPVPEVPSILSLDPPEHTRLRKLTNKAFSLGDPRYGTQHSEDYRWAVGGRSNERRCVWFRLGVHCLCAGECDRGDSWGRTHPLRREWQMRWMKPCGICRRCTLSSRLLPEMWRWPELRSQETRRYALSSVQRTVMSVLLMPQMFLTLIGKLRVAIYHSLKALITASASG